VSTAIIYIFDGALKFNQALHWDFSNIVNMGSTFRGAVKYNKPVGHWNMARVTSIAAMFQDATEFNQDLGGWNTNSFSGDALVSAFNAASKFNGNLCGWNTANCGGFKYTFLDAAAFNRDLSCWDMSGATNFYQMFKGASSFDKDIGNWDTRNVVSMKEMFWGASRFNRDLDWDVKSVTSMQSMFRSATDFNGDITSWETGGVKDMASMFMVYAGSVTNFDQDLSGWNVGSVTNMAGIFGGPYYGPESLSDCNKKKVLGGYYWSRSTCSKCFMAWSLGFYPNTWGKLDCNEGDVKPKPSPPPLPPPPPPPAAGPTRVDCSRVPNMFDLRESGKWCNSDETRSISPAACHNTFRTGTDGHVYACYHDGSGKCKLSSVSTMCCDHLCEKLGARFELNKGTEGSGPWCGTRTGGGEEDCIASYWTGRDGRTYPCVWDTSGNGRRLLFATLPHKNKVPDNDQETQTRPGDEEAAQGRAAGGRCRLSRSDACTCND